MPGGGGDDLFLNGVGRAQSVYQQPSTGEKHVLFYPTSPAPSVNSEERRSWSQASSSFANTHVSFPYYKYIFLILCLASTLLHVSKTVYIISDTF